MEKYKAKVKDFLNRFFTNEISDDDNFFELGFVNSLFAMQLVMFLEKEFSLSISNEELDFSNFSSINAICRFLNRKGGGNLS